MKKSRYISFVMLLQFVVAVGCRLMGGSMCSCPDPYSAEQEHICCSCSEHISQCANHDYVLSQGCCAFHDSGDSSLFLSGSEYRGISTSLPDPIVLFICLSTFNDLTSAPSMECNVRLDIDISYISSLWSVKSYWLTSPPVLV